MIHLIKNVSIAFKRPKLALKYLGWLTKCFLSNGAPVRNLHGIRFTNFNGFSEYHSLGAGVSQEELAFINSWPFGDGVMIDVGANLGLFSLLLSKRYPDRRVLAFEPSPSTCSALKVNVIENGARMVECFQKAIADREGFVAFSVREHARANASIRDDVLPPTPGDIQVPCTSLDAVCAAEDIGRIAMLKVDVEGYESLVFRGAAAVLSRVRPDVIYFEVCPGLTKAAGFGVAESAKCLADHGYSLHRFKAGGGFELANADEVADVLRVENWVAVASQ